MIKIYIKNLNFSLNHLPSQCPFFLIPIWTIEMRNVVQFSFICWEICEVLRISPVEKKVRKIVGIIEACTSRRSYLLFFDWFYPAYFPILLRTVATWSDTPSVIYPVLRFTCEFVYNVHSRIDFESSSANGTIFSKFLWIFSVGREAINTENSKNFHKKVFFW